MIEFFLFKIAPVTLHNVLTAKREHNESLDRLCSSAIGSSKFVYF